MGREHQYRDWSDTASCAFDIVASEFVVVTADAADLAVYGPLSALLQRVRKAFGMDAAFIADWTDGEPVVHRPRSEGATVGWESLHATYAERLFESAPVRPLGKGEATHFDAVPVTTRDGYGYGTLCCRSVAPIGHPADASRVEALHSVARLIGAWFEEADLSLSGLTPLAGESVMGSLSMTTY